MLSRKNISFILLIVILFLSGSFSLIYQVAWVRVLTLLLGSTTMGITTVVSTFMSGLALGSWLSGKYLISRPGPLRNYAFLELFISVTAFMSPLLFAWSYSSVPFILQSLGGSNASIFIVRILYSVIFMLIPTICMGAALPVLGRYFEDYSDLAERRISVLYGFNTIGACAGCIASGYILLPSIGLRNTLYFTAAANALLPVAIYFLNKIHVPGSSSVTLKKTPDDGRIIEEIDNGQLSHRSKYVFYVLAALVGFTGLSSELVWTRLIVLTVGGSVYAYSTILAVYLFFYGSGLSIGGASLRLVNRYAGKRALDISKIIYFTLIILIALAIAISIPVASYLPDYYVRNFRVESSASLYGLFHHQLIPAIMLMGTATLFLGMFFPYGLFLLKKCGGKTSENTSKLYAFDTIGSIAGSIAAAFLLIPYIGLDNSLRTTGSIIIIAGLIAAFFIKLKKFRVVWMTATAGLLVIWFLVPEIDKIAITSGAGVYAANYKTEKYINNGISKTLKESQDLLYYRDGFTSTVTVIREKARKIDHLIIKTNGKADGSSHIDMPTQKLCAHFPVIFHPKPEKACVIGYGSGTTIGSLAMHKDIHVDVVEIEPAMIEGAAFLDDFNNKPLSRNNVDLILTDGRLFLQMNKGKYDIITSEPSNPWLAGVSDLFTQEYYILGREALSTGGVFAQWIQVYNLDSQALKLVFRTFTEVFDNSYLVVTRPGTDLLLIGTTGNYIPSLSEIKEKIKHPEVASDLADPMVRINNAYDLLGRLLMSPENIKKFAEDGNLNTDDLPYLSYIAPLSLFDTKSAFKNMEELFQYRENADDILGWELNEEDIQKLSTAKEEFFLREVYRLLPGGVEIIREHQKKNMDRVH